MDCVRCHQNASMLAVGLRVFLVVKEENYSLSQQFRKGTYLSSLLLHDQGKCRVDNLRG